MKTLTVIAMLAALMFAPFPIAAEDCQPRDHAINFRGVLLDGEGEPFDGTVDVEVSFYGVPSRDVDPPLYRESFAGVVVARGILSLPLLKGAVEEGSPAAVVEGADSVRYVDVWVDGALMVDLGPLGRHLAAIRAEEADFAYGLKEDIELSSSDIPTHKASKVTSGALDPARLPSGIDAANFSSGVLTYGQLPLIPASKVTSGTFSPGAIPDVLSASLFTEGTLSDDVLPDDIIVRDNIYVGSGTVGHLGVIPVPMGFTRDYCQWVIGIHDLDGSGGVDQFQVYTDQNGVVTCRWSPDQADEELNHYCVASYLLVCMK